MNVYAESSAVLAWLLGETDGHAVRQALAASELIIASELTLIECNQVLIRAFSTHQISEAQAAERRARLSQTAAHWVILLTFTFRMSCHILSR
ncbi:MAG: hypothetical protein O7G88_07470 [bacterium]|nr:hypothetical protein [bacterium]